MLGLETNVLVRCLVGDDPGQYRRARRIIRDEVSGGGTVFLSHLVLLETEWVLRSRFGYSKGEVMGAMPWPHSTQGPRSCPDSPPLELSRDMAVLIFNDLPDRIPKRRRTFHYMDQSFGERSGNLAIVRNAMSGAAEFITPTLQGMEPLGIPGR